MNKVLKSHRTAMITGESIQVGSLCGFQPVAAQVAVALVIGEDDDDVGPFGSG